MASKEKVGMEKVELRKVDGVWIVTLTKDGSKIQTKVSECVVLQKIRELNPNALVYIAWDENDGKG